MIFLPFDIFNCLTLTLLEAISQFEQGESNPSQQMSPLDWWLSSKWQVQSQSHTNWELPKPH